MAAGDRKVKVASIEIDRANPVTYRARWGLWVENKLGVDVPAGGGTTLGNFGTPATWRAMTGTQMETQVNTDCAADANLPPRDSLT